MACTADRRQQVQGLADVVTCDERVVAVDVLAPGEGHTDLWTAELTLAPGSGGLPPALLREIAHRELTVRESQPQGLYWRAVVAV